MKHFLMVSLLFHFGCGDSLFSPRDQASDSSAKAAPSDKNSSQEKEEELSTIVTWDGNPARGVENLAEIYFERDGKKITLPFEIQLWMPAHNHGSAPIKVAESEDQAGVYLLSNIYFTMRGTWELQIRMDPKDPWKVVWTTTL